MARLPNFWVLFCFARFISLVCCRVAVIKEGEFDLEWEVSDGSITVTATAKTLGYVGFGISPWGSMMEADLILAGRQDNGSGYIQDLYAFANASPVRDTIQDVQLLSAKENGTHTIVTFTRKQDTGDTEQDLPITNTTQLIIWAYGPTDQTYYHGPNRGTVSLNLVHP